MKTLKFANKEEWMQARVGKITGSRLGDLTMKRGGGYKKGFYELIAERIATSDEPDVPTNPMERGSYLELKAIELFGKKTKKKVDPSLLMWISDENENIAVSPDGVIGKSEAVECKCLSSASHVEAFLKQQVPDEYEFQVLQYFIVNPKLKTLYFMFYDPRMPEVNSFFYFTIKREDKEDQIKEYLEYEKNLIVEVEKITNQLTF